MDHQLIGVLFLSLSHLYLFLLFLNLWLLSDVCLSVGLSVSIFVYLSISLLKSVWPFNSLFICPFIWLYALPSFYLSVFSAFLTIGLFDCLSLGPLIDFGLKSKYKIKAIFICFSQKLSCQKNISKKFQNRETLRHKMIKQEIVLI